MSMRYDACIEPGCPEVKTKKQRKSARCRSCANRLKNTGRTHSQDTKDKLSAACKGKPPNNKGKPVSLEARRNYSLAKGGDGDILNRKFPGLSRWTASVKRTFTCCVVCRSTEMLEAHHIAAKAKYPELATFPLNGLTLCKTCHDGVHYPSLNLLT